MAPCARTRQSGIRIPNSYVGCNVQVLLEIEDYFKELDLSILRVKKVMSNHVESSLDLIFDPGPGG